MSLQELKGVGDVTVERLNDAGVTDLEELARSEPEDLTDSGISENKAGKIIERAEREAIVLMSGDEAREQVEEKGRISTGMEEMDEMLDGGWREGDVVGVAGGPSTGKTQLVFQSLVEAVEQTGDPAVYIETEPDRYEPDRIAELSTKNGTQSKIYKLEAHSLTTQAQAYEKVAEEFKSVSMVAVDSFTYRLRLELFKDRSDLGERNSETAEHLHRIEQLQKSLDAPVLLTLQMQGNPQQYGGSMSSWGPMLMDHSITYTILLKQAQGSFRKALLRGHPGQPADEVMMTIGERLKSHREE